MNRKIFIVSPVEPSGATWAVNCLLELGYCAYRYERSNMWDESGGRSRLRPNEDGLKKWLPSLYDRELFRFEPGVEFEWVHDWPTARYDGAEILYFTRDPRDSFFSAYKRTVPEMTFAEFAGFPHVATLFSRIDNWSFYSLVWASRPSVRVFRFEDYRADAMRTLQAILGAFGLSRTDAEIRAAAEASSYARSSASERRYVSENPAAFAGLDERRRGSARYREEADPVTLEAITNRCAHAMRRLGYPVTPGGPAPDFSFHIKALPYFSSMRIDPAISRPAAKGVRDSMTADTMAYAQGRREDLIARAGLGEFETDIFRRSLEEFARRHASERPVLNRLQGFFLGKRR